MEDMRIQAIPEKNIMKRAQKVRGVTQDVIAERIGIKRNSLCQNMNRTRMSLDTFAKVLDALEYDIIVTDRETGEPVWQLYVDHGEDDDDI